MHPLQACVHILSPRGSPPYDIRSAALKPQDEARSRPACTGDESCLMGTSVVHLLSGTGLATLSLLPCFERLSRAFEVFR